MSSLIELYQKYCPYQLNDNVQLLDFNIDIDTLRQDMFSFIANNKFSYNAVSLRLPAGQDNYIDPDEVLEATAVGSYEYISETAKISPINSKHNKEYQVWHSDLKDTYVTRLVPQLENLIGLKIGRIRLGWLMPDAGYPMHLDLEPMRLHIPLITNNSSYFIHDSKLYQMQYGKLYHLITTGIHTAWNFGKLPRLHLIFSTYGDQALDQALGDLNDIDTLQRNFVNDIYHGVNQKTLGFLLSIADPMQKKQMAADLKHIKNLLDTKL
jgi:hypothetical protein